MKRLCAVRRGMSAGRVAIAAAGVLALLLSTQPLQGQLQQARLGSCTLEMGGVVEDCRLAYMTFGELAEDRSNAILVPTWFSGRAEDWRGHLGPEGMIDTSAAYVIVVESFGSGRSSSPTTSGIQEGVRFPEITVGDMVETSYRLVNEHLGLTELEAVVGFSLGALQALEWVVARPDHVRKVVSLAGNPRQDLYQRALWDVLAHVAETDAAGTLPSDDVAALLGRLGILMLTSPAAVNRRPREGHDAYLTEQADGMRSVDLLGWAWQARAISRHDVARHAGGDLSRAASRWSGDALMVTAVHDHSISPESSMEFARLIGAEALVLDTPSGHAGILGDSEVRRRVREFLSSPDAAGRQDGSEGVWEVRELEFRGAPTAPARAGSSGSPRRRSSRALRRFRTPGPASRR